MTPTFRSETRHIAKSLRREAVRVARGVTLGFLDLAIGRRTRCRLAARLRGLRRLLGL